jgi:hypothetical protein
MPRKLRKSNQLPEFLRRHFWDAKFAAVSWKTHRWYIISRLLWTGNPRAVAWLRKKAGDEALRAILLDHKAFGLTAKQVAPWITKDIYATWIAANPQRAIWIPGT